MRDSYRSPILRPDQFLVERGRTMKISGGFAMRSAGICLFAVLSSLAAAPAMAQAAAPSRSEVESTMRRATEFMVDKVSYRGGYLWNYLPDFSRRWGEMEARETQIWLQPPGTSSMGHLFLERITPPATSITTARRSRCLGADRPAPSGGWNYLIDFAGARSLRDWYDPWQKRWRLENSSTTRQSTFDDQTTTTRRFPAAPVHRKTRFTLQGAGDRAIAFVGGQHTRSAAGRRFAEARIRQTRRPDTLLHLQDDVAWEVSFLILSTGTRRSRLLVDLRGMNFFLVTQQGTPSGWYAVLARTQTAAARSYEPLSLARTPRPAISHPDHLYELTGDTRFLARVPEAIEWLEK